MKMTLTRAYDQFEEEFNKIWSKYVQLHKDLDVYRGVEITPSNVNEINKIVSDIQDCFILLWPSLKFVKERTLMVEQAMTEYNKFMDDLKSTGAEPENVNVQDKIKTLEKKMEEAEA